MSFIFKKTLDGSTPQYESIPLSNVALAANAVVNNASGYADDAGTPTTIIMIGVAEDAVDNSGGSAGDLNCNVITNRDAVFDATDTDTHAQAQVWKSVAIAAGGLTVAGNTATTNTTAVFHSRKFVSTSVNQGTLRYDGEMA